jgi:hypothetical protein
MAKDWSILGRSRRGLAVEGKDDKVAIEAFLEAGEQQGQWARWRERLVIVDVGSWAKVIDEIEGGNSAVWGLIDRDWRTDKEIKELQSTHEHLLVLPRITIENYCVDPDELSHMLPSHLLGKLPTLNAIIESHLDSWVHNGALRKVMHESGADDFCRGHDSGYPMALLHEPIRDEGAVEAQLREWHEQLNPQMVMSRYRTTLGVFRKAPDQHYAHHIQGKHFFQQVVVSKIQRY